MNCSVHPNTKNYIQIAQDIKRLAHAMGFHEARITRPQLPTEHQHLQQWLERDYAGTMDYLRKNIDLRLEPSKIFPNTQSIICLSRRYPKTSKINCPLAAFAIIEDYHRSVKKALKTFCRQLGIEHQSRCFCGSAPILEKALAAQAGLGWIGKNSLLVNQQAGSYLFLGEIFTELALPVDQPIANKCGNCTRCINNCPTGALVAAQIIDARKCISYLTIENKGSIPIELRAKIGQRIFGCDACQQSCMWNQQTATNEKDKALDTLDSDHLNLAKMMLWDENELRSKTATTPIKRISFSCWLRNLAVALGNADPSKENIAALEQRKSFPDELVQEHCQWALRQLQMRAMAANTQKPK